MNKFSFFLFTIILLTSCVPATVELTATLTAIPTHTSTITPSPTLILTPTFTSTPLPINFIYQDDVPAKGRMLQEQAANKAYFYYSQYADLGEISIYTFSDINQYIEEIFPALKYDIPTISKSNFIHDWVASNGANTEAKDIVIISSTFLPWKDDANLCYKPKNVAHELFHMVQSRLMHHGLFRPALDYGPEWLKEGSAEFMGNNTADNINGCSYQNTLEFWIEDSGDKTFSLAEVDGGNFSAKVGFWSVAPLAVDHLVKISPNGEKSLIDFYSEIGDGKRWREAFVSAFGISVEDYYVEFKAFQETIKITLDTSVCIPQSNPGVKCLGRKPNKANGYTYNFSIPFAVLTQPQDWKIESNCALDGYGAAGSDVASNLLVNVNERLNGTCHIRFSFSADKQVTIDFISPVDLTLPRETPIPSLTPTTVPAGMVAIKGNVILADPSQKFTDYIVSFCNSKIVQCLPGNMISDDGSFVAYLDPGDYKMSVNPLDGGDGLGWYTENGLYPDPTCAELIHVADKEINISVDFQPAGCVKSVPTQTAGTVRIQGNVTLKDGTQGASRYGITTCKLHIVQDDGQNTMKCSSGSSTWPDGSFILDLLPGKYWISINSMEGSGEIAWYFIDSLVKEPQCGNNLTVDQDRSVSIIIDPDNINVCR